MKPEWKDAPKWANYIAQDRDGCWYWFEHKPKATPYGSWIEADSSKYELAQEDHDYPIEYWRETLNANQAT